MTMPVYGTIASQFNDPGANRLYHAVIHTIADKTGADLQLSLHDTAGESEKVALSRPGVCAISREITETIRSYDEWERQQAAIATTVWNSADIEV